MPIGNSISVQFCCFFFILVLFSLYQAHKPHAHAIPHPIASFIGSFRFSFCSLRASAIVNRKTLDFIRRCTAVHSRRAVHEISFLHTKLKRQQLTLFCIAPRSKCIFACDCILRAYCAHTSRCNNYSSSIGPNRIVVGPNEIVHSLTYISHNCQPCYRRWLRLYSRSDDRCLCTVCHIFASPSSYFLSSSLH